MPLPYALPIRGRSVQDRSAGAARSRARTSCCMPPALIVSLLAFCTAFAVTVARAEPSYGSEVPPASVVTQLDQLAPQRPGTVDLYAIVVGGDGMEEVF